MDRKTVVSRIARRSGLEQKAVATVIRLFLGAAEEALLSGEPVSLRPLGTLKVSRRRAKVGRNPQLNEPLLVEAHLTISFRPGDRLKKRLNQ